MRTPGISAGVMDAIMNRILLKPDGSIVFDRRIVNAFRLSILGLQVELGKGYTLRSFFKMLKKHPLLENLNDFLPACRHLCDASPEEGCRHDAIEHLEFCKTIEMAGFPSRRMEIYTSLKGIEKETVFEIGSLGLELLLDVPVRLGSLKHVVFGDRADVFEFETVYTLFEFVDGVAWNLGFQEAFRPCEIRR